MFVCHWEQLRYPSYRNADNFSHCLSYRRSIIPGIVGALPARGNLIKKTVPASEVASTLTEPQIVDDFKYDREPQPRSVELSRAHERVEERFTIYPGRVEGHQFLYPKQVQEEVAKDKQDTFVFGD